MLLIPQNQGLVNGSILVWIRRAAIADQGVLSIPSNQK
jgi:hypothetical protein